MATDTQEPLKTIADTPSRILYFALLQTLTLNDLKKKTQELSQVGQRGFLSLPGGLF